MARELVFGLSSKAKPVTTSDALHNLNAAPVRGHQEPLECEPPESATPRKPLDEATI